MRTARFVLLTAVLYVGAVIFVAYAPSDVITFVAYVLYTLFIAGIAAHLLADEKRDDDDKKNE